MAKRLRYGFIGFLIIMFLLGWVTSSVTEYLSSTQKPFSTGSNEMDSPGDWIKEGAIKISKDGVYIDIANVSYARFADTNSMDPVLDASANSLEINPEVDLLQVGDIVSYRSNELNGLIIHRIIDIKEDSAGKYYILKGDNNNALDPEKVRFDQIQGVVIGILY